MVDDEAALPPASKRLRVSSLEGKATPQAKLDAIGCAFLEKGAPKQAVLDVSGPLLNRHLHSEGTCPPLTSSCTLYNWRRNAIGKPIAKNNSNNECTAIPLLPPDLLCLKGFPPAALTDHYNMASLSKDEAVQVVHNTPCGTFFGCAVLAVLAVLKQIG